MSRLLSGIVGLILLAGIAVGQTSPPDSLPPLRSDKDTTAVLPKGEPFFDYRSDLGKLKSQIDSLKQVLKVYEKRQALPKIDPKLLEMVKAPELSQRIILQNGTVVLGEIIRRDDLEIVVRTQLGELVIDAKHVAKVEENAPNHAEVKWVAEPRVAMYPDREVITGQIKNTGKLRADFVRVVAHCWNDATDEIGLDSAFVKGKEVKYSSGVITDSALEPGQVGNIVIAVSLKQAKLVEYHTYDIRWIETR